MSFWRFRSLLLRQMMKNGDNFSAKAEDRRTDTEEL